MKKEKRGIRFGYFAIASVFLFNPMIATIDVLPDFIGYLLICSALSGLCEINEHFWEARSYFNKLLYVSVAKFALSSITMLQDVISGDTYILLYLFVFGALTVIFGIPAIKALGKGIQYLTVNAPSDVIDKPITKNARISKNELVERFTAVFTVIYAFLTVIPELFVLGKVDNYGNINYTALENQGRARMICFFTVLAISILWLVMICVYFSKICRDKKLVASLEKIYLQKTRFGPNALIQRQLRRALSLLSLAFIFSIDFFIDDINILPNFISALFVLFAVLTLKEHLKGRGVKMALCILSSVSATVKWIIEVGFLQKFTYGNMAYYEEAKATYITLSVANAVDTALHLAVLTVAILIIREIIKHHTGLSMHKGEGYYSDPKISELHKELLWKTLPITVFAVIRSATCIFYYIAQAYTEWYFDLAFYYHFIACGIMIMLVLDLLRRAKEEISYKYMVS